jgi:hypothetical protein
LAGGLCKKHYNQRWAKANPGRLAETQRQWRVKNADKLRKLNKDRYKSNWLKIRDSARRSYMKHRSEILDRKRRYREVHSAEIAERFRDWSTSKAGREYMRLWKLAHTADARAYAKRASMDLKLAYVARCLRMTTTSVPPALIEAKRAQLKLLRLLKEKNT